MNCGHDGDGRRGACSSILLEHIKKADTLVDNAEGLENHFIYDVINVLGWVLALGILQALGCLYQQGKFGQ